MRVPGPHQRQTQFPENFIALRAFSIRRVRVTLICCLMVMLTACTSVPKQTGRSIAPENIDRFDVAARIGVKQGKEGFSGNVRWKHATELDELWLISPLGQIVARLRQTPGLATLATADKKLYQAIDVEALTQDAFGWSIPLSGMRYWLLGMAAPTSVPLIKKRDSENRITEMEQDGWEVEISEYKDPTALPGKLKLRYRDLEIKLLIDNWLINGSEE